MQFIKFFKVNSLPQVLEPDSVYFVNNDGVLNIYVSDNTGQNSFELLNLSNSSGLIPYPARKELMKAVCDNNTNLTTVSLITKRLCFIPFVVPRHMTITAIQIDVATASAGSVKVGIYSNTKLSNGSDNPYKLLSEVSFNVSSVGIKPAGINFKFKPNTLYWFCYIASSAPVLKAVNVNYIPPILGRITNGTPITLLYSTNTTFELPLTASTNLAVSKAHIPCIYLVEQ